MDEVDPLHGYAVGDKVQWIEKDTAYLMKGFISGESELETEWGRCIKVQFGKSCYDVLPFGLPGSHWLPLYPLGHNFGSP